MYDSINFLRKLSFRKAWNILLIQISFILSGIFKIPIVWGKPWFVSIEPSSVCNLSCPQCPVGEGDISRGNKFLSVEEYSGLLNEIASTTAMLSLYFQGEPLMHKQFVEFVRLASSKGIYTQTSTNGQLLTSEICRGMVEAGLDRIIVSADGLNQESYEKYRRGGDFEKLKEGIRNLADIRNELGSKRPLIIFQFLVFKHNEHQLADVDKVAAQLGADRTWIKTAQIEYPETASQWIPDTPDNRRYEKTASGDSGMDGIGNPVSGWKRRGKLINRCKRLWHTTVICSDGLMVPCCFDKRARYSMGITGKDSVAGIWKSKSYRDFRKRVLVNRKTIAMCRNCTEGVRGIYN